MKQRYLIAVLGMIAFSLLSFVACTSTNHEVALSQNKGIVGKNGIPRPDWVIYDQSNAVNHYVSAFGTGKTFEVAKQKAQLNADAELALWISNTVKAVRDRYVEDTIVGENETYLDSFVSTATEKGQAVLSGATEIDFWEDGEGGVWVLRMIPVANVKAQIEAAIASTTADESIKANLEKALNSTLP